MALQMERNQDTTPAGGDLALGFVGVVSPMNAAGLAPFSYLGTVFRRGLVLTSAAVYQVSFARHQQRMVERLLETPYSTLTEGQSRVYETSSITRSTLRRQFATGFTLTLGLVGGTQTRLIVQQARVPEIRSILAPLLAGRFVDET